MSQRKPLIRRTFLQERLEILIKRQRNGTATFNELTELDDIVNADPEIRKRIIMESMFMDDTDFNEPTNIPGKENSPILEDAKRQSFLSRLKALINRIFTLRISTEKLRLSFNENSKLFIIIKQSCQKNISFDVQAVP